MSLKSPRIYFLIAIFLFINLGAHGQQKAIPNYPRAVKFDAKNISKLIFSTSVEPRWIKNTKRFWYVYETSNGKTWYIVDPAKKKKRKMFDNAKMAADLSTLTGTPYDPQHLPDFYFRPTDREDALTFSIGVNAGNQDKKVTVLHLEYNFEKHVLRKVEAPKIPRFKPSWASISPDGQTIIFARSYNLYAIKRVDYDKLLINEKDSTVVEQQLTKDGVEDFGYSESKSNGRSLANILWSPDSRYFAMVKKDGRKVKDMWVINSLSLPRPSLQTFKYDLPGESETWQNHLVLFDLFDHKLLDVNISAYKDQQLTLSRGLRSLVAIEAEPRHTWQGTSDYFYITRTSRDFKNIDLLAVDVKTATAKAIIQETMSTSMESRSIIHLQSNKEFIHWSERDGWAHFYLYDSDGSLKNQITSGPWHCNEIIKVDEQKRVLYFTANGRESGENPYYTHFYKVNFDGSGLRLLNSGNYDHRISPDESCSFFVDNFSRVDTIPRSSLYDMSGRKILDLEQADFSSLLASGYKFPEVFKVKADDGISDLYGVMYKPYDFDSTKKYPIATYVYPGPQKEAVEKNFSPPNDFTDRLAQIGMVVVSVGNRGGSPVRSKWYHNFGYGNIRDYAVADKKAAVEQLAAKYSFMDIDRVGIHGHSGGGALATTAILLHPDFFKVAVSCSGNHDNSIYNRWWNEMYNGVEQRISAKGDTSFLYKVDKNISLAKNLKGRLMLMTGEIDDNVVPAHTLRMANALMRANKRFDMVMFAGQSHTYGTLSEWAFWSLADYYSKWLMDYFDLPVDITETNSVRSLSR